jgi:hypothetical protein
MMPTQRITLMYPVHSENPVILSHKNTTRRLIVAYFSVVHHLLYHPQNHCFGGS